MVMQTHQLLLAACQEPFPLRQKHNTGVEFKTEYDKVQIKGILTDLDLCFG